MIKKVVDALRRNQTKYVVSVINLKSILVLKTIYLYKSQSSNISHLYINNVILQS